jgi:Predicted pyridoxal phosphate-dependent enzyme apparently involved in regulation of cell wall biogenesis
MNDKIIPLIDLKAQNNVIGDELIKSVNNVLLSAQYIMGPEVKKFEMDFSNYLGVEHAISCGNGTDALIIALEALGIGDGDEVITTPYTFFATGESISYVGATPVFVDVDADSFNIDITKIEAAITPKTKAIMPVHLFGNACEMDTIMAIANKYNLYVIEDACQAIGGEYNGKKLGTIGHVACFSFFPTKNLGAAGDGGMIVTNDEKIATICKALKAHGSGENGQKASNIINSVENDVIVDQGTDNTIYNPLKYFNYLVGHNSRLDEVQAAVLNVKLKYLDDWNAARIKHADYYTNKLKSLEEELKFTVPKISDSIKHVFHMYILRAEHKDALIQHLKENGISTGVYYPVPLHLQKAFEDLGYNKGDFPIAEYLSERTFAIPMYAELKESQQFEICECIKKYEA